MGGAILGIAEGTNTNVTENFTVNISNCTSKNIVVNGYSGIMGCSKIGTTNISNCMVQGLTANNLCGGVIGISEGKNVTIAGCSVNGITRNSGNPLGGIIAILNQNNTATISIKNCKVKDISSNTAISTLGGIVAISAGNYTIENCDVANINTKGNSGSTIGGIVAVSNGNANNITGQIKNCNVNGLTITDGVNFSGGIIALAGNSTQTINVDGCNVKNYNSTGGMFNAGIAGIIHNGSISNCSATDVTISSATMRTAGICGQGNTVPITNCKLSNGSLQCNSTNTMATVGGIAGLGTSVSGCSVENTNIQVGGSVLAVGGILGHGSKTSTVETLIQNCKYTGGSIKGTVTYMGGIAGVAVATITNCSVNGTEIEGTNTTALGGIQGYGGALVGAQGNGGSTTPTTIDKCDVTNCGEIKYTTGDVNYYEGKLTDNGSGTSQDSITNCSHEGTWIGIKPPTTIAKISSTDTSITVKASGGECKDGEVKYQYAIGDSTTFLPEGGTTENYTFSGLNEQTTKTYNIKAITIDNTGKKSIETVQSITIRRAVIPTGFKASIYSGETTIKDGLVIYQTTNNLAVDTGTSTTNHDYAMANYNQFVWIPVDDINSMIMCKSNTSSSVCNITQDATTGELTCITHNKTGATNICGRLYGVFASKDDDASNASGKNVLKTTMNFSDRTQTFSENYKREPDIVIGNGTEYDGDSNTHGLASASAFLTQLQNDFYAMAKSVALNKGFYIGRYEAGYDSSTYTSKKGQVVMNGSPYNPELAGTSSPFAAGVNTWYGLYNHLRTTMGSLNSHMIWGCQYDQVIKFIKENKEPNDLDPEIGHPDIILRNSAQDVSGATVATGANDIMKNIYDLIANCDELTAEANGQDLRVNRATTSYYAYYNSSYDSAYPASYFGGGGPTRAAVADGSRPGLYL